MKSSIVPSLFFGLLLASCNRFEPLTLQLNENWVFRKTGDSVWLPASVPGCVHTDLLKLNRIPDPFFQMNEKEVKWVEEADWEYECTFTLPENMANSDEIELVFGGLDTYAEVFLNDSAVLKSENMFVGYTLPVKYLVRTGENRLRVCFHSAVNKGMEKLRRLPHTLMAANELAPENERTNVFSRKAPFHFGWDWGPRLVTCGIWQPVRLQAWNVANLDDVYIKPLHITAENAVYSAMATVHSHHKAELGIVVSVDGNLVAQTSRMTVEAGENTLSAEFSIEKPEFWWTRGLGNQKLYSVQVDLYDGKKRLASKNQRIGVRTVELVQEPDSTGRSFFFKLNGVPVFMKGANYIPSDIFLTRNTEENYKRVVRDAAEANMNMLRIWGGAVYEGDALYDLLDENGILAWNDFQFACSVQPVDPLHLENIRKEAEYNVRRLRNHPSVALWCGNNENLVAWYNWGWKDRYKPAVSDSLWQGYKTIFYEILPNAVRQYHPEVTYWPSSPQSWGNQLPDRKSGDEHDWTIWFGDAPFAAYAENVPRFVSEYGMQSFPEIKTIRSFANDSDLAYRSPLMDFRQRSNLPWIGPGVNGNEMIMRYITRYFPKPNNFDDFIYLSQLMQAEAFRSAIEAHRRNMPHCMGSLYWQINDCWPTMSWSSVDYFGRWKASHFFVKKAFDPLLPVVFTQNDTLCVSFVNDRLTDEPVSVSMNLLDFSGSVLWEQQIHATARANSSHVYYRIPLTALMAKGRRTGSVFVLHTKPQSLPETETLYYFAAPASLSLEKAAVEKKIARTAQGVYEITLRSDKLVKNLALTNPLEECTFSDNFFDMLPGRNYTITYSGKGKNLDSVLEIRSVNSCR